MPLTRLGHSLRSVRREHVRVGQDSSYGGSLDSGRPRLAGVHLSMEPASGWALGVNRLLQYGGGARPGSFNDLLRAFFSPSRYDNTNSNLSSDQQFGNQVASVTSSFLFPGRVPFSVYFEYAGEDTSTSKNYLLGNAALSAGIHFPRLWRRFDLTYEVVGVAERLVRQRGLRRRPHQQGPCDRPLGRRQPHLRQRVGAQSHMLKRRLRASLRRHGGGDPAHARQRKLLGGDYRRAYDATLSYCAPVPELHRRRRGLRRAQRVRRRLLAESPRSSAISEPRRRADPASSSTPAQRADESAELFVEAGLAATRASRSSPIENVYVTENRHRRALGASVRVAPSPQRSDLGARLELDDVDWPRAARRACTRLSLPVPATRWR